MTCRISHFQDGRSFQQNPLVSFLVDLYAWHDRGKSSLTNGNIDLLILFEWRRISDDIQSDYELLINSSKNRIIAKLSEVFCDFMTMPVNLINVDGENILWFIIHSLLIARALSISMKGESIWTPSWQIQWLLSVFMWILSGLDQYSLTLRQYWS
jgi:hypothetical protein